MQSTEPMGIPTREKLELPGYTLLAVVFAQILLGIATLLSGVNIVIAVSHQANAVLLLITTLWTAHALGSTKQDAHA